MREWRNSDFWKQKWFTTNLLRPSSKSCLVWFQSVAQLRYISCLEWAEIVVLKPLILWIVSLITRYVVTIPITVKIEGERVRLICTGGYFGLFSELALWLQSVMKIRNTIKSLWGKNIDCLEKISNQLLYKLSYFPSCIYFKKALCISFSFGYI